MKTKMKNGWVSAATVFIVLQILTLGCVAENDSGEVDTDTETDTVYDAGLSLESIIDGGDAIGDCDVEDTECTADIVDLLYAATGSTLVVELSMEEVFPATGTFEIFWIPPTEEIPGFSFRYYSGQTEFWTVDCSTVKHDGCHWAEVSSPASFEGEWITADTYRASVGLTELGFAQLEELRIGVGAAHEAITATAEFTDRFPDELWITATEIQGLASISIGE